MQPGEAAVHQATGIASTYFHPDLWQADNKIE
jgi:hypothetical protein